MRMTSTADLRQNLQLAAGLALTSAMLVLSGCAFSGSSVTTAATGGSGGSAAHLKGSVFGGQQPVNGAVIQLYTVGTTGPGSPSTPMLTAIVKSAADGSFDITGKYSCSSATQVYIVATTGDAGSGNNSALSLMAALGPCAPLIATPSFININELTTVAAVYTLAPFMSNYQSVGGTGSNPTGLVNAFAAAQALVSTATGAVATQAAGVTLPTTRLNTLADILASCVNTSGPTSPACTTLLAATSATETIGAGLAIAQDPANTSLTALYSLPTGTPPFVPTLSAQPKDFTLAVNYTSAALAGPFGVAIDASGNAWVTNEAGTSVVKLPSLSPAFAGTAYSNGGLLAPRGISIDRSGHVWIANTGANDVVELDGTSGAALSSAGFGVGSLSGPVAIANDSAGNAWVANFLGNSISELGTNGAVSGASPITGAGALNQPNSVAIDSTGRVAVANAGSGSVCLFSSAAALQSCPTDGTLFGATSVAISSGGSVAVAGSTTGPAVSGAFTLATTAGAVNPASPAAGGGLTLPTAVAYDSAGNAWFTNATSLSAFSAASAETGSTGIGSLNSPSGLAIDASGNIWTANTGDNSVSVFVGLAAPVTTPMAANVGP